MSNEPSSSPYLDMDAQPWGGKSGWVTVRRITITEPGEYQILLYASGTKRVFQLHRMDAAVAPTIEKTP